MKFIDTLKSRNGRPINFRKIEPRIEKFCGKFNIVLMYIFGSYALGNAGKISDLDVAVLSEKGINLDKTLILIEELQKIFAEEAVDFVDLKLAPLTLIHRVLKEGRCLYAQSLEVKIEFETKKESLYYDTAFLRKEHFEAMKRRIRNGSFGYR
ncbi:MAG: nucleotidyltransferase domain-containing protein [Candidatus Omnitrophota bacterium]